MYYVGTELAPVRTIFTLPFVPSHRGREEQIPSPLMGEG